MPSDVIARLQVSVGAGEGTPALPSLAQRLIEIVPANPVKAAVDGALLPLVVFSLAIGFALKQVPAARREPVIDAARGVSDAMLVRVFGAFSKVYRARVADLYRIATEGTAGIGGSWADWGRFRAVAHRAVADVLGS